MENRRVNQTDCDLSFQFEMILNIGRTFVSFRVYVHRLLMRENTTILGSSAKSGMPA